MDPDIKELLKKSILQPGFEKHQTVPVTFRNKRVLQKIKKKERSTNKGEDWFNLPATEVTDEIKNDFQILRFRSALDPKHVYKKNSTKEIPKFFQIGKVVEGAADFYCGRLPKSQRKRTMVEELLADSECRVYQKKKYNEILSSRRTRFHRKKSKSNVEKKHKNNNKKNKKKEKKKN